MPSRVRVEQIGSVPLERAPGYEGQGQPTAPFASSGIVPPNVPDIDAIRRGQQEWAVTDAGVTHSAAGDPITIKDVSTVNANAQGLGYSFPGTNADDNDWTVEWAVPTFMSPTPNLKIRLYLLADGAGAGP